jgi:16S rRNA (guanine1207-N2)-methyltransferase
MNGAPDKSVTLLLQRLSQTQGNWLVVADENWCIANWSSINPSNSQTITAVSNRINIAVDAQSTGIDCQFSDFDFSDLQPQSFDGLLYRVSKERATSHHIINSAFALLKPQGILLLGGEKNDGIKTYIKQAGKRFDNPVNAEKQGRAYIASIALNSSQSEPLNDKNYSQLRSVQLRDDFCLQTKPGIFGWDKIDRGSAFLIDHLEAFLSSYSQAPRALLDLGCGYGYLALCASKFGFERLVATDNNAAALIAVKENLKPLSDIKWDALATDAGDAIEEQFDTILCNPPFHAGFAVDDQLSVKFLNHSKRLLAPKGRALFVVNTFIPLEQKAMQYFDGIEVIANNGAFKLITLNK